MERIKSIFIGLGGLLFFGLLIFLGSDITKPPPSNAVVVLKHDTQEFLAPPCLNPNYPYEEDSNFEVTSLETAKGMGYEGDNCTEHALYPTQGTFTHYVLVPLNLAKPLNRWDKDGNWTH